MAKKHKKYHKHLNRAQVKPLVSELATTNPVATVESEVTSATSIQPSGSYSDSFISESLNSETTNSTSFPSTSLTVTTATSTANPGSLSSTSNSQVSEGEELLMPDLDDREAVNITLGQLEVQNGQAKTTDFTSTIAVNALTSELPIIDIEQLLQEVEEIEFNEEEYMREDRDDRGEAVDLPAGISSSVSTLTSATAKIEIEDAEDMEAMENLEALEDLGDLEEGDELQLASFSSHGDASFA